MHKNKEYMKHQLDEDKAGEQLTMKIFKEPFTGSR